MHAPVISCPRSFDSSEAFNSFCRLHAGKVSESAIAGPGFAEKRRAIVEALPDEERVIKTPWGGVFITLRNDPEVEKFLVVDSGKWLALEKHEQKVETLEVKEGLGVLIYQDGIDQPLKAMELKPGVSKTLQPGLLHCIISKENLLVFEKSMDYKGMDKDLIFEYEPVY